MTAVVWVGVGLAAQLGAASIDIQLTDSSAAVDARYEVPAGSEAVRVVVMRVAGQQLDWLDGPSLRETEGLYESLTPAGASRVRFRYEVSGALDRIPLPVPSVPVSATADAVSIRVTGGGPLRRNDAFPRFEPEGGGMVAHPSSVPSFVRVPGGHRLFTNTVADGLVLATVILAVAMALWRHRAGRRPARA